ncbi:hypothetical protein F9C07_11647 [Aspergillus flavus]|uniref:Uncharacterized protein n=1 Tax=Aspergillus flavus (strain ATCC 200026 / FGSC A1120 / IAM 13836 / NRRL 3357 / JCM 12722 / SRRC 167) TaxID=332952 RepID=A0A7U2N3Z4_ASPFN|nr:hypothetical protein F9C07_11647 [Aspergillus flavus]
MGREDNFSRNISRYCRMLFAGLITRLVRDEQKEGPIAELCSSYPMVSRRDLDVIGILVEWE